ncbi:MAG: class I SAM-dependent methyltransferase [Chloroflexi bacterium]|nr:class I SAM-dependent methyltransferase [Chloroflexota bacterium]
MESHDENSAPTQRFSERVENYVKYRPSYPGEIIPYLEDNAGLTPESVIADVGSGTGILSKLFLDNGNPVYGIEPNAAMRAAGEEFLNGYAQFTRLEASAEATSLPDNSVDFITAGQAFHWFEYPKAKVEFQRILKPGGVLALLWNVRDQSVPFVQAFEKLMRDFGTDYTDVRHTNYDKSLEMGEFFNPNPFTNQTFRNQQVFDFNGLQGRLLSASFAPMQDHPNYTPMLAELRRIFDKYQDSGQVILEYNCELYWGRLGATLPE